MRPAAQDARLGIWTLLATMAYKGHRGKAPFEVNYASDCGQSVTPHVCAPPCSECTVGRALTQGMHVLHVQDAQRLRQLLPHME